MIKHKVAVLISGNGSNLQVLLDESAKNNYPAKIEVVISNKEDAYGLVRARNAGVIAYFIDHKKYEKREDFDSEIHKLLVKYNIEFVCLAGFMRLLSPWFVQQWKGKMINIHPSLLPNFKGANAVRDALASGVKETGCTVHLVTEEMDEGEIILQSKVPILNDDTEATLHERIHKQEHFIYPQALKMLIDRNKIS